MNPEKHIALITWNTDDVFGVAHEEGFQITQALADAVIDKVDSEQDADAGVNWETLRDYVFDLALPGIPEGCKEEEEPRCDMCLHQYSECPLVFEACHDKEV
jgi:hypothetical protein